jgi:hypothetical protein
MLSFKEFTVQVKVKNIENLIDFENTVYKFLKQED